MQKLGVKHQFRPCRIFLIRAVDSIVCRYQWIYVDKQALAVMGNTKLMDIILISYYINIILFLNFYNMSGNVNAFNPCIPLLEKIFQHYLINKLSYL